jgi:hypothetical protein
MDQWRHYKENGDLCSAFEVKPYSRKEKKCCKKLKYILFLQYFFTFPSGKIEFVKGQQRSILIKTSKTSCDTYLGLGLSICIYQK